MGKQPKDIVSNVVTLFPDREAINDVHPVVDHFLNYFEPVRVHRDIELMQACYDLRHRVYCEELSYENSSTKRIEIDQYDGYAESLLLKHLPTDNVAGTIRVIAPKQTQQNLPIEDFYQQSIDSLFALPAGVSRHQIGELSRIAVSPMFRRRESDQHAGAATGIIDRDTYSEIEVRCFPLLVVGLYLGAAALCQRMGVTHAFAMMERELTASAQVVGIDCHQIGDWVDYHGTRAPFYIDPASVRGLRPGFTALIKSIQGLLD